MIIMEPYQRTISLKTIWLTIVRRYLGIILIFVPIALASLIVTQTMMTKTYMSSFTLSNAAVINATQYAIIQNSLKDSKLSYTVTPEGGEAETHYVYTEAAKALKTAGTKHFNGAEITADEIYSRISVGSLATNSITLTFSYFSADSLVPQKILDATSPFLVTAFKQKANMPNLSAKQASNVSKSSSENRYFIIALAAGLVIALALPFIDEILSDEVWDYKDIYNLGADGFEIKASAK